MYNLNGILLNNWCASYNKNNENYITKELPSLAVHKTPPPKLKKQTNKQTHKQTTKFQNQLF